MAHKNSLQEREKNVVMLSRSNEKQEAIEACQEDVIPLKSGKSFTSNTLEKTLKEVNGLYQDTNGLLQSSQNTDKIIQIFDKKRQ